MVGHVLMMAGTLVWTAGAMRGISRLRAAAAALTSLTLGLHWMNWPLSYMTPQVTTAGYLWHLLHVHGLKDA